MTVHSSMHARNIRVSIDSVRVERSGPSMDRAGDTAVSLRMIAEIGMTAMLQIAHDAQATETLTDSHTRVEGLENGLLTMPTQDRICPP